MPIEEGALEAVTNTYTNYTSNTTGHSHESHLQLAAIAMCNITSTSGVLLFGQKFPFILVALNTTNDCGPKLEIDQCSELAPQSTDLGGRRDLRIYGAPLGLFMGLSEATGEGDGLAPDGESVVLGHEAACS